MVNTSSRSIAAISEEIAATEAHLDNLRRALAILTGASGASGPTPTQNSEPIAPPRATVSKRNGKSGNGSRPERSAQAPPVRSDSNFPRDRDGIVEAIRQCGPMTPSQLSKKLGISLWRAGRVCRLCEWFEHVDPLNLKSPYQLTDKAPGPSSMTGASGRASFVMDDPHTTTAQTS